MYEVSTISDKGHQYACLTTVERVSRYTRLAKLNQRTAQATANQLRKRLEPLIKMVRTITSDNGKECNDHSKISSSLGCDVYFADPDAPWQRGANEVVNGLRRE